MTSGLIRLERVEEELSERRDKRSEETKPGAGNRSRLFGLERVIVFANRNSYIGCHAERRCI
jgi:hypothetical protein